jgi:hypothetical protein
MFPNFPALKDFLAFWGKITRRIPFRSHRCPFQAHQASRTARRRRRVPVALIQLEQIRRSVAGRDAATNCGAGSVREPQIRRSADPDQLKANGPTVDVATKSTQGGPLLDRNSITFDNRIQPSDRCCSRHDRGRSFGICFSSIVASPSKIALVRSGGRKANRSPCRTTFG